MKNYLFNRSGHQIALLTILSAIYSTSGTIALSAEARSFCTNTCKGSQCKMAGVRAECKNRCQDSWKIIAIKEMNANEAFRQEQDETKRTKMMYDSQIAQCLDIHPAPVVHQKVPEPQPLQPAIPVADRFTNPKDDLCAAALAAVGEDLNQRRATFMDNDAHQSNIFSLMETQVGQ